ncbi:MAG TPA: hypothetical protein VLQ89_00245 [Candidatus Binatia bacterium]|nr:hypothetical protein [Candidatus Binatia bacterium]
MNTHILKKPTLELGSLEIEIQHRLQRGKIKLLISHIFFFILTVSVFLFAF